MCGIVTAVSRSATHTFSKATRDSIRLLPGLESFSVDLNRFVILARLKI